MISVKTDVDCEKRSLMNDKSIVGFCVFISYFYLLLLFKGINYI